eukprot:Gb_06606 [translate_table: standard]
MAGAFGGPYTSIALQNQNAGQINGQLNASGNSGSAVGNDSFTSHLAGMSKNQLYDIMSQMKVLIEQNQQQARQILVDNPPLTKALFQAQIMLGMVRPPQVIPNIQQSSNLPPQQPLQAGQQGQNQPGQQGQINSGQNQVQPRQQTQMQVGQHGQASMGQQSQPQSTSMQQSMQRPQHIPPHSQMQVVQQSQAHLPLQPTSQPMQQPQGRTLPMQIPIHSAPQNLPMQPQVPILPAQPPQPTPGIHQPVQPPLPQHPRPPLQPPPHQLQSQPTQSLGFQPSIVPQQHQTQAKFQPSGNNSQTSMGIPFQQHAQPPLPSQPPPQQLYQMNSGNTGGPVSHTVPDMSGQGMGQGNLPSIGHGGAVQVGRGLNVGQGLSSMGPAVSWMPVPQESAINGISGVQHSSVPSGIGGPMGLSMGMIAGMSDSAGPSTTSDGSNRAYSAIGGGSLGGGMNTGSTDITGSNLVRSQGPNEVQIQTPPQQQQQASQMQLPPELEKALLQQVMSLTPEQINCLPPEQRQQVLQLQQMLR